MARPSRLPPVLASPERATKAPRASAAEPLGISSRRAARQAGAETEQGVPPAASRAGYPPTPTPAALTRVGRQERHGSGVGGFPALARPAPAGHEGRLGLQGEEAGGENGPCPHPPPGSHGPARSPAPGQGGLRRDLTWRRRGPASSTCPYSPQPAAGPGPPSSRGGPTLKYEGKRTAGNSMAPGDAGRERAWTGPEGPEGVPGGIWGDLGGSRGRGEGLGGGPGVREPSPVGAQAGTAPPPEVATPQHRAPISAREWSGTRAARRRQRGAEHYRPLAVGGVRGVGGSKRASATGTVGGGGDRHGTGRGERWGAGWARIGRAEHPR